MVVVFIVRIKRGIGTVVRNTSLVDDGMVMMVNVSGDIATPKTMMVEKQRQYNHNIRVAVVVSRVEIGR